MLSVRIQSSSVLVKQQNIKFKKHLIVCALLFMSDNVLHIWKWNLTEKILLTVNESLSQFLSSHLTANQSILTSPLSYSMHQGKSLVFMTICLSQHFLVRPQGIGVARGCSGCTCTPQGGEKIFFRPNLQEKCVSAPPQDT